MDNWHFPLIAHKAGVRTFDLSSGMNYVSMKDQVVRGTTLVNCLIKCKIFDTKFSGHNLVVVGAGAAGVAAACHAAGHGLRVLVLERASGRFPMQKQCTSRRVSFSMYDWPEAHASSGIFPSLQDLPVKSANTMFFACEVTEKHPIVARDLVTAWDKRIEANPFPLAPIQWEFNAEVIPPRLSHRVLLEDDPSRQHRDLEYWKAARKHSARAQIVIFATGIGIERSVPDTRTAGATYQTPPFWSDMDNPPWENAKDFSSRNLVISGGGDGAIQDFLKVVLRNKADNLLPLARKCRLGAKDRARIISAERHIARQLLWDTSAKQAHAALQAVYDEIVETLLRRDGDPLNIASHMHICPRIVWISDSVSDDAKTMSFSKSYPLNRFLATLVLAVLAKSPKVQLVEGTLNSVDRDAYNTYRCTTGAGTTYLSDFPPLLRHGVERNTGLGKNAGYFGLRQALAGAPLPFKPSDNP